MISTIIEKEIEKNGHLSVADFMGLALGHPEHGYYITRDPLGKDGDFTTAPEISQCFGEMIALYLIQAWEKMERPSPLTLIEAGPGRGTLMKDVLRIIASVAPDLYKALSIELIETSPSLIQKQKKALEQHQITWKKEISFDRKEPVFFIANEFFDALPIHQFEKQNNNWMEKIITIKDKKLTFDHKETQNAPIPDHFKDNDFYEHHAVGEDIFKTIQSHIQKHGGLALIIDYGFNQKTGLKDTLQALKSHRYTNPLENIGEQDLTSHINFARLGDISTLPNKCWTQGEFLTRMGIKFRMQQLAYQNPAMVKDLFESIHRLTDPAQMGDLFKVFVLSTNEDCLGLPS